jgi:molybdenum cofactor cytidylyltransferase
MSGICAIILAAGESTRMGSPKMLLDFNGKSMLECVIGNVSESVVDDIVVVLGAYRTELEKIVLKTSARFCYNDNYKEGMLSSVKCGFRNIPADTEAVLVFQGDQPLICSKVINEVVKAYRNSGKGIIIPVYKNRRGHPLMVGRIYISEIEKLSPDEGLRSLSQKFPDDIHEVVTDEAGILRDFDTFEEYKKAINQIQ